MSRMSFIILFVLIACATGLAQTSYMGLTPGQSTRADVERVLGRPVKEVSKTLVEYKAPDAAWKLYLQYRDELSTATVERIERTCRYYAADDPERCTSGVKEFYTQTIKDARAAEERSKQQDDGDQHVIYYGAPWFIVLILNPGPDPGDYEYKFGFYSKELYESVTPLKSLPPPRRRTP